MSSCSNMVGKGTVTSCKVGWFGDHRGEAPVPRGATLAYTDSSSLGAFFLILICFEIYIQYPVLFHGHNDYPQFCTKPP